MVVVVGVVVVVVVVVGVVVEPTRPSVVSFMPVTSLSDTHLTRRRGHYAERAPDAIIGGNHCLHQAGRSGTLAAHVFKTYTESTTHETPLAV